MELIKTHLGTKQDVEFVISKSRRRSLMPVINYPASPCPVENLLLHPYHHVTEGIDLFF